MEGIDKRFFLSGLILAALLITGVNRLVLIRFINSSSTSKEPEQVMLAQQKQARLRQETALAKKEAIYLTDSDTIFARYTSNIPQNKDREYGKFENNIEKKGGKAKKGLNLPVLTGITQCFDINGNTHILATMGGMNLAKHQKIQEFTVDSITERGVILKKGARHWFVPAPEVRFSLGREK